MAGTAAVSQLNVYPVKACRGISCSSVYVSPIGLAMDRKWVIIRDEEAGRQLTQRQVPKLCQIEPSLPEAALLHDWAALTPNAALELNAPGQAKPLRVPLNPPPNQPLRAVVVWEFKGQAVDEGDEAAAWLSKYLGQQVRLARYLGSEGQAGAAAAAGDGAADGPSTLRRVEEQWAVGAEVRFADGYPLLVVREENLADLNTKLTDGEQLPMNRFRPNIVLKGSEAAPWSDDTWKGLRVGSGGTAGAGVELTYVKPCGRCKVPTINQATAVEGREPLVTLKNTRSGKLLGWNEKHKSMTHEVFFGWNAVPQGSGVLRVGDVAEVLGQREWQ